MWLLFVTLALCAIDWLFLHIRVKYIDRPVTRPCSSSAAFTCWYKQAGNLG